MRLSGPSDLRSGGPDQVGFGWWIWQVEAGDWVRVDCEERAAAAAGLEGVGLPRV